MTDIYNEKLHNRKRYFISFLLNNIDTLNFKKLIKVSLHKIRSNKKDVPHGLNIEVTSCCSAACVYCWSRQSMTRPQRHMDFNLFKKIIDETYKNIGWVGLYFQGEPLLNPAIIKMIKYANSKGLYTEISTNATHLNKEMAEALVQAQLDSLVISFDSPIKETWEKFKGIKMFDKVMENLQHMSDAKIGESKPYVCLKMTLTEENKNNIDKLYQLNKKFRFDEAYLSPLILKNANEKQKEGIDYVPSNLKTQRGKFCSLFHAPIVLSSGEVSICCFDINAVHNLGNIQYINFMEIWNSDKYKKIRSKARNFELDLCKNCLG